MSATERNPDGTILATDGLVKRFGQFTAIDDVSLSVHPGEFRSIIGPNGAGKTTLFNLLSGGVAPTSGTVTFAGEDITSLPVRDRVHRGLSRSFQITNLFDGLSVHENVRLAVQSMQRETMSMTEAFLTPSTAFEPIDARTQELLELLELDDHAAERAGSLAHGDKRRLEIGLVLASDPTVVMLDEPTAGMSLEETHETIALLERVLEDRTLLLIEHDMELVMELSDTITVLNRGEIIAEGSPEAIADDDAVREAYLGGYE